MTHENFVSECKADDFGFFMTILKSFCPWLMLRHRIVGTRCASFSRLLAPLGGALLKFIYNIFY
jgi:hypothetical protein